MDNENEDVKDDKIARPFLILDVRDPDQYNRAHLAYSYNYQHTRLNRAFDYETKEMLRVKNKAGAILVVYDDDEYLARQTATTLTQRGYDNVFMLSGGLRVASLKYPDTGLVVTDGQEDRARMEEGDVILLETCLEDNIRAGEMTSSSRSGRSRQRHLVRSSSMKFGDGYGGDFRTSTALGAK